MKTKKTYITPAFKPLRFEPGDLLIQASNTQAATDADALSHQNNNSFWDDTE